MPGTLAFRVYKLIWHSLDWIYPPQCAGCGRLGSPWCDECNKKVILIGMVTCPLCGIPQPTLRICPDCQQITPYFMALRSWAVYKDELRKAIHRLKYRRDIALGMALAVPMINKLRELNWSIDLVVPVPLGLARLSERGYNQASLLARPIALYFHWSYQTNSIQRIRETQSQVGLAFKSRAENVKGAFIADSSIIRGKKVLVVDDVITSGSTMNSCAEALRNAGAEEVYGFSLARAGLADQ